MAKKTNTDPESATTQVNIADFQRTRDSRDVDDAVQAYQPIWRAVQELDQRHQRIADHIAATIYDPEQVTKNCEQVIVALATLQSSVQDLSRAYINHANTVLAPGRGGELNSNLTNILSESGLLTGSAVAVAPVTDDAVIGPDGKKKRKRQPHDPNAPKRALTPYFLYMQSARTQIAKELGDNAKPKEVADEGTRRWTEMSAAEKAVWDALYQKNFAIYRVRMAAFKNKQDVPSEEEAARLVEAGKAPEPAAVDEEIPSEESTPERTKEPELPKAKRRKSDKPASPVKETPKPAAKSSEKKSKKAKKEASPVPEPASTKSDKKKRSKKA